ncbi:MULTISPECIES: hypothetical protein [Bacteroidales]|uniref:hypothetical protein n=1 Tax=Bacteroidales TaxID=171549 RepID=UPI0035A00063
MSRNIELIRKCRFYDGVEEFNREKFAGVKGALFFWQAEKMFVNQQASEYAKAAEVQYKAAGLSGFHPELPLLLRALLFSIFCKGSDAPLRENVEGYKTQFIPAYLGQGV